MNYRMQPLEKHLICVFLLVHINSAVAVEQYKECRGLRMTHLLFIAHPSLFILQHYSYSELGTEAFK